MPKSKKIALAIIFPPIVLGIDAKAVLPSSVAPLAFTLILGKVNLPSASLQVRTLPACEATVSEVSAVKLTNDVLPADINPANDLTGPENVD